MLEKFYKYKAYYKEYIILIKTGNFYTALDNDAFIVNKLFGYRLIKLGNTFKIGFPVDSLNRVLERFNAEYINHVVLDNEIILKKVFVNNKYSKFKFNDKKIFYNYIRIQKITKVLNDNYTNNNFEGKLNKIENLLFK